MFLPSLANEEEFVYFDVQAFFLYDICLDPCCLKGNLANCKITLALRFPLLARLIFFRDTEYKDKGVVSAYCLNRVGQSLIFMVRIEKRVYIYHWTFSY